MEVEVVFLEVNKKQLVEKLISLGAQKILDVDMKQVNYMTVDGHRLRIRDEGEKIMLAFKKILSTGKLKIADEHETQVVDFDETVSFIQGMGLVPRRFLEKHRESYKLGKVRFDFDDYLGDYSFVPEFLEIESNNEDDIKDAAELVGLSWDDAKNLSTGEIITLYE